MSEVSDIGGVIVIDVQHDHGDWSAIGSIVAVVREAADAVASHGVAGTEHLEACVALSGDQRVCELNKQFRGKDKPTNVLSFPAPPLPAKAQGQEGAERFIGDIILACETVLREAADLGISPRHHLQHLVVHGLLHLIGYDHDAEEDAERMEAVEVAILSRLGIPDPYMIAERSALG